LVKHTDGLQLASNVNYDAAIFGDVSAWLRQIPERVDNLFTTI
jgi:hypothetical protein